MILNVIGIQFKFLPKTIMEMLKSINNENKNHGIKKYKVLREMLQLVARIQKDFC